jgi:hypothetical protein
MNSYYFNERILRGKNMSVVRVTEITASSIKGFKDALRSGNKN